MFAVLKRRLGLSPRSARGRRAPARQGARLGVEGLEAREVLSGFGALPTPEFQAPNVHVQALWQPAVNLSQSLQQFQTTISAAVAKEMRALDSMYSNWEKYLAVIFSDLYGLTHQVPNLGGVTFQMKSQTNGGSGYTLLVGQQTDQPWYSASFTGLWSGHAQVTGTLWVISDNSIGIRANWGGGQGKNHTLTGTITGQFGSYHIEADVTEDGGGGPGHLSGNQV
jgi:hypothetical protein